MTRTDQKMTTRIVWIFFVLCCHLVALECTRLTFSDLFLKVIAHPRYKQRQMTERIMNYITRDDQFYSDWSEWSPCNKQCFTRRLRHCTTPASCGTTTQRQEKRCSCDMQRYLRQKRARKYWRARKSRRKEQLMEELVYDMLYNPWSQWSACTRTCKMRRYRTCAMSDWCRDTVLMEDKRCHATGSRCDPRQLQTASKHTHHSQELSERSREAAARTGKNKATLASADECGLRNNSRRLRIVGGSEAARDAWPWQVAILTRWHDQYEQYCGGVLIGPQWVLTAAHCLRRKNKRRKMIVRVGEYDLDVEEGREQDLKPGVDFVHQDFNMDTIDSDIGLIKLRTPVNNIPQINFACLPTHTDILPENTMCFAVGWGKTNEKHGQGSQVLREASIPLVRRNRCRAAFDYHITSNQMCAGYRRGGVDTCAGDSGGPLMCEIRKDGVSRWHVYGVTSFGEGCGERGKYGIYTITSRYHEWIKTTINQ